MYRLRLIIGKEVFPGRVLDSLTEAENNYLADQIGLAWAEAVRLEKTYGTQ